MSILDLNNLSIEQNKLLNDISVEIKSDFHVLVDEIYSKVDNNIYWYVNSLLSRNNFVSQVFFNLCYLELVKKISNANQIDEVIVLNLAQKDVLKNYYRDNKVKITFFFDKKHQIKYFFKPFYGFLKNLLYSFLSIIHASKKRRNKFKLIKSQITIIDTFATPIEFKSGDYKSRHYPNDELWDYLTKKQKETHFFYPEIIDVFSIGSVIKCLCNREENYLFRNDFLNIRDYMKAILSPIFINKVNFDSFLFREFKIKPLLNHDYYINRFNSMSFKGILNYYFFERAKECGIKLKLVLNWFENQPTDKGFNLGVRTFYPNTKIKGFQPFLQDLNFQFHLCPTKIEEERKVIPQSIVVIGNKYLKLINKFYKGLRVTLGPGIRFKYIHKLNDSLTLKKDYVFVALPISLKESRYIINTIGNLIEKNKNHNLNKKWVIKPHPELNFDIIINEFKNILENFKITYDPINILLQRSSLMITNGSTVAFEAMVLGIPVCVIAPKSGFIQNPVPVDLDSIIIQICYNEKDVFEFLQKISTLKKSDKKKLIKIGKKIKTEYFEPVNLKTISSLLQLK